MAFPYQPGEQGALLTPQAILGGVASVSGTQGVFVVSTINPGAGTTAISANQQLSAQLLGGTAFIGDVSSLSPDAGLFRVSSIGSGTGDRTLVDGTTQTISATLTPISAKPAGTIAGLVTNTFQQDASQFRTSAILAAGVSSSGAQNFVVSGVVGDGGTFRVSAGTPSTIVNLGDAFGNSQSVVTDLAFNNLFYFTYPRLMNSATNWDRWRGMAPSGIGLGVAQVGNWDASLFQASTKSPDAGLFRISGIGTFTVSGSVSAVITNQPYVSAFIDNGSISARSGDANQVHVSSVQGDAGLQHTSAINQDANFMHVSGFNPDAGLFRVSATNKAVTDTELSMFSTSAGIAQLSVVKSTGNANLYGYQLFNPAGVQQYLQIFNASATSAVTLGTTVAAKIVGIPATGGGNMSYTIPPTFTQGIVVAVTSTAGGNTAGASAMITNIDYL